MTEPYLILNAKGAISRHVQWKITLQLAIAMREPLSADQVGQISHYRRCAIGQWLESPATLPIQGRPQYAELVRQHIRFHEEMKVIADLLAEGSYSDAAAAMKLRSPFDLSSEALAAAIMACDRVFTIAVPHTPAPVHPW